MTLYTYFRSSAAYRVRIALNLKGLLAEMIPIHLQKEGGLNKKPQFRAINPQMRVPALRLDCGEVLIQSLAIIEYLDEVHPHPPLLPGDPVERAKVRAVAQVIACDIHPLNNVGPLRYLKSQLGQPQDRIDAWYHHWILEGFETVETLIGKGPYAFGKYVRRRLPGAAGLQCAPSQGRARSIPQDCCRRCRVPGDCGFRKLGRRTSRTRSDGDRRPDSSSRPLLNGDCRPRRGRPANISGCPLDDRRAAVVFRHGVSIRALAASLSVMEILALRRRARAHRVGPAGGHKSPAPGSYQPAPLWAAPDSQYGAFGSDVSVDAEPAHSAVGTVFALEFTTPAWTLLLALPVLGERMTVSRVGAVVLGLVGVLVILRPGVGTFRPASVLVLGAAIGIAITLIATKKLTRTDSSFAIIFWMNLIQAPLAFAASQPLFVTKLSTWQMPAVAGIGCAGLISHYCLANAFRAGDATVVVPLDFMRIPLIAVIGWWLYGERLDPFVFAGAGLIIAGVLWNLRAEARTRRVVPARPEEGSAGVLWCRPNLAPLFSHTFLGSFCQIGPCLWERGGFFLPTPAAPAAARRTTGWRLCDATTRGARSNPARAP